MTCGGAVRGGCHEGENGGVRIPLPAAQNAPKFRCRLTR
jgi:hypothetical protein